MCMGHYVRRSDPNSLRVDTILQWLNGSVGGKFPDLVTMYLNNVDSAAYEAGPQSIQVQYIFSVSVSIMSCLVQRFFYLQQEALWSNKLDGKVDCSLSCLNSYFHETWHRMINNVRPLSGTSSFSNDTVRFTNFFYYNGDRFSQLLWGN